jgi:hypothetical protein
VGLSDGPCVASLCIKTSSDPQLSPLLFLSFPSWCKGFMRDSEDSSESALLLIENYYSLTASTGLRIGWEFLYKNRRDSFSKLTLFIKVFAWSGKLKKRMRFVSSSIYRSLSLRLYFSLYRAHIATASCHLVIRGQSSPGNLHLSISSSNTLPNSSTGIQPMYALSPNPLASISPVLPF